MDLKENMIISSGDEVEMSVTTNDINPEKRNTTTSNLPVASSSCLHHCTTPPADTGTCALPTHMDAISMSLSNPEIVADMQQDELECSLSISSASSDTCDGKEPKPVSNLTLQPIDTNYNTAIENTPTVRSDDIDIISIQPTVPTTIKSTSIGHLSESEDDYLTPNDIASQLQMDQQCAVIRTDINANYIKYKWRKLITKPLLCSR
eukprot:440297_1